MFVTNKKTKAIASNDDGGRVKKEHATRPVSRQKRMVALLLFHLLNPLKPSAY
jgi:hypothetical protein